MQAENGRSDPSNIERDRGPNPLDMRHSFNGNVVYTSESHAENAVVRQLLSGNQLGVILQINSGLPVNISAVGDINGDGVGADRPNFVVAQFPLSAGAEGRRPAVHAVDPRARVGPRRDHRGVQEPVQRGAAVGITTSRTVDTLGNPTTAIPRIRTSSRTVGRGAAEVPARVQGQVLTGR